MSLSSESIVRTACGLLTDYGLQDVTMRRLAAELGVRPGAIYYHVPSKQELLRRVAHRLLAPLEEDDSGPYELLLRLRRAVLPLRDGGDLLLIAYGLDQEIPPVPALRRGLEVEGRSSAEAEQLGAILMRFALGAIAVEQNIAVMGSPSDQPGAEAETGEAGTAESADLYEKGLRSLLRGR